MTHDEKIYYLQLACGLNNFHLKKKDLDLIITSYELILEKKGQTNLKDVVTIKKEVEERHKAPTDSL